MSDKEIIVRLAALVAMVDDGHTRLTIPREHPEIGLEFGHTATSEPEHSALRFSQLPLAFEQFEDGVYVVAANSEYARLIGYRLDAIDSTPIAEAMTLELVDESGGVSKVSVEPLPTTALEWIAPSFANATPLRLKHPEEKFWSEYVDDGDFVYMQMDEIADGDIPLAEFVVNTLGEPTGSRPDHFGDPKKLRLKHSGLTLRVSRLHWSSYTAFDERASTNPDFVGKWTSKDYFAGDDPALNLALSLENVSIKSLLRGAFGRGDMEQIARYTLERKLSADSYQDDFSAVLLDRNALPSSPR